MKIYRRYVANTNTSHIIGNNKPEKHGSYGALLFDRRWKEKRAVILLRDSNKCVICSNVNNLEVHHRQYHYESTLKKFKAPWEYSNNILLTLCNSCHQRGHSKFKIPIIYV